MLRSFREKARDAYGYAAVDAVNTLLIHERMAQLDRDIYRSFGIEEADAPPMKATLGSRVATFLSRMSRRGAAGSEVLGSDRALRDLMRKGGRASFGGERGYSRFGYQTGQVHGGLNFSRSPARLWHQSGGMIRDVDMAGCYPSIIEGIDVYWGRSSSSPATGRCPCSRRSGCSRAAATRTPGTSASRATSRRGPTP